MPLCGFNKEMLEGLYLFHKGLVEHGIINRSINNNISVEKTIQNEIKDMDRFLETTKEINNKELRELIENLTKYSQSFYKLLGKFEINNYEELLNLINKFYYKMDEKYYTELQGKTHDMEKLIVFLNKIIVEESKNATVRI